MMRLSAASDSKCPIMTSRGVRLHAGGTRRLWVSCRQVRERDVVDFVLRHDGPVRHLDRHGGDLGALVEAHDRLFEGLDPIEGEGRAGCRGLQRNVRPAGALTEHENTGAVVGVDVGVHILTDRLGAGGVEWDDGSDDLVGVDHQSDRLGHALFLW